MMSESRILDLLKGIIDPDVGLNIVDLGLVETIRLDADKARIGLIMTTPACPQAGYLADEARRRLKAAGIAAEVEVLSEPLWQPDRLSEAARAALGWPG